MPKTEFRTNRFEWDKEDQKTIQIVTLDEIEELRKEAAELLAQDAANEAAQESK